jgi:hypothetical protein
MPRSLTAQEQALALQFWPRISPSGIVVTGNPTRRYNCLAWTLGISTRWIWPWAQTNVSKAQFDSANGYAPGSSGPIAAFGLNANEMKHGSISGPGHGSRWESKCGAWLRLQHGLAEMEGGLVYGDVLGFYTRLVPSTSNRTKDALARAKSMKAPKLTPVELKFVRDSVGTIDPRLRKLFEQKYDAWKKDWDHPFIAISSSPVTRAQTPTFLDLVALGPSIIPLLMEKLTHSEEFFALQAVDRLIRPEFVVTRTADDPANLLGEQGRALETVKNWARTQL